jgi:hypothetical protein
MDACLDVRPVDAWTVGRILSTSGIQKFAVTLRSPANINIPVPKGRGTSNEQQNTKLQFSSKRL